MTNSKTTKRALLSSVIALILCFSMLLGTTFAWFTDSVSSGVNTITAGNLDIELEYSKDYSTWAPVQDATQLFADVTLWEPGTTSVVYLRMTNKGTLALKYQFSMNIASETTATSVNGSTFKLSEHLKYGLVDCTGVYDERNDARQAVAGSAESLANYSKNGTMVGKNDPAYVDQYMALVVYMPEDVGNEANYRGNVVPTIELGLNLVATQQNSERDSFGPDYDTNATTYLNQDAAGNYLIGTADELVFFAKAINTKIIPYSNAGKNFKLTADIDLGGRRWAPIGRMINTNRTGEESTFQGNFDGGNFTISNFKVDTVDGVAGNDTNKGAGLFGAVSGTISNLKVTNATIVTAHWAGAIAGVIQGTVENCSVENTTITCLPEWTGTEWDNGDKAGSIVGYLGSGTVTRCSAKNVSITGYRDLGGIVGCSNGTVTYNTVGKNVSITYDNDETRNYKRYTSAAQHNIGDYIGRDADENDTGNTGTANYVRGETAGTAYDTNATFLNTDAAGNYLIGTADELVFFAKDVNVNRNTYSGKTVKLTADIDLTGKKWIPVGQAGGYTAGAYFQGTFDGNGKTISNLTIPASTWEAGNDNGTNFATGFFGFIDVGNTTIKDVTFNHATVEGHHWVGVAAGYMTGTVSGVKVTNSTITSTWLNNSADGDKAGGVVGYLNSGSSVTGCTVTDSTITAIRDCGSVVGHSVGTVTGNTAQDCTVYYSTDNDEQIGGEIAGKRATGVSGNTATSVTVTKSF